MEVTGGPGGALCFTTSLTEHQAGPLAPPAHSGPFPFSIPAETSKEKGLDLLCDIFIWVPMTAACFLLLLALAVTVMLCQRKSHP